MGVEHLKKCSYDSPYVFGGGWRLVSAGSSQTKMDNLPLIWQVFAHYRLTCTELVTKNNSANRPITYFRCSAQRHRQRPIVKQPCFSLVYHVKRFRSRYKNCEHGKPCTCVAQILYRTLPSPDSIPYTT